ncbi:MAG: formylglycine-generating enzyme family protein [Pleomorphochaeta sp.]
MKEIKDLPEIDDVVLPKVGNMRPGVYVLALVVFVVLLVIFLIGFLPGILNGGKFVNFNSEIDNVGVYVDGNYISGTPAQEFIESGEHEVVYKKASQIIAKENITVGHPLFLTYIFHRYQNVNLEFNELTTEKINHIINYDINLIIDQSSILTFNAITNYIPYFSQYAKDAVAFELSESEIKEDLNLASSFITSVEMLEDAKAAYDYIGIDADDSLLKAEALFNGDSNNIGKAFKNVEINTTIDTLKISDKAIISTLKVEPTSFVMGDTTYNTYPSINEAGIEINLDSSFYLSKTPISNYLYSLFIVENPTWAKSNIESLLEKGLVDENYLKGISLSTSFPSLEPITNISYYAAEAFCTWLSAETNTNIFIPSEEQWTLACFGSTNYIENTYSNSLIATTSDDNQFDLMLGGVWEYTSTPYIPLSKVVDNRDSLIIQTQENYTTDIVVKGGSLLNNSVDINRVGAMKKSACFEYMGFRIAYTK